MTDQVAKALVAQIDAALTTATDLLNRCKDDVDHDEPLLIQGITRVTAAISRCAPPQSQYIVQMGESVQYNDTKMRMTIVMHIALALRDDLTGGYLRTVTDLIHGELFADFLEMADHLQKEGYKDAAAVIAGSSLEAHLRALCDKNGIPTSGSDGKPKKSSLLNDELTKASAYSKGDQKQVTAWLDTRNSAAHGKYNDYTKEKVDLMIAGIRDFINRTPA